MLKINKRWYTSYSYLVFYNFFFLSYFENGKWATMLFQLQLVWEILSWKIGILYCYASWSKAHLNSNDIFWKFIQMATCHNWKVDIWLELDHGTSIYTIILKLLAQKYLHLFWILIGWQAQRNLNPLCTIPFDFDDFCFCHKILP